MNGAKHRPGFTLIELLVVSSVFSLLFLIGTTVFIGIQSYQRGIYAKQRVSADGRYLLEAIARQARLSRVNYDYYRDKNLDLSAAVNMLALRDQQDQYPCYFWHDNKLYLINSSDCGGYPDIENYSGYANNIITSDDLEITAFDVYINPQSDPFMSLPPEDYCFCSDYNVYYGYANCVDANPDGTCPCNDTDPCWSDQRCVDLDEEPDNDNNICRNAVIQPHATIIMRTRSTNTGPGEAAEVTLQTTVTSRLYGD